MLEELEYEILQTINSTTNFKTIKESQQLFYKKIHRYEMHLYNENRYTPDKIELIEKWRKHFRCQVQKLKEESESRPLERKYKSDSNELEETVQLVARQILKAEHNKADLENSTVKLKSLNISSKELQKEIDATRRSINMRRLQEKKEIYLIKIGFLVLIIVCIFIVLDKFGGRKLYGMFF